MARRGALRVLCVRCRCEEFDDARTQPHVAFSLSPSRPPPFWLPVSAASSLCLKKKTYEPQTVTHLSERLSTCGCYPCLPTPINSPRPPASHQTPLISLHGMLFFFSASVTRSELSAIHSHSSHPCPPTYLSFTATLLDVLLRLLYPPLLFFVNRVDSLFPPLPHVSCAVAVFPFFSLIHLRTSMTPH